MSRAVVDRQGIMFSGCPSIHPFVCHSTYIIYLLQLNLDNGRSWNDVDMFLPLILSLLLNIVRKDNAIDNSMRYTI